MLNTNPSLLGHTNGSGEPGHGYDDSERETQALRIVQPLRADAEWPEQIAMISHELRNSLAVLRNSARVLGLPAAKDVFVARTLIERQVSQMSRHVDDLLALVIRENRGLRLRRSYIDLCLAARNAIDGVAPDLARRGHRLSVSLPPKSLCIFADSARLEQVFTNLLMNAAKYTPDGGDIAIAIECHEEKARIRIRDSGVGIAPAMLTRVFEMYVQADASAPNAEGGHGIGLAVVRSLVEQHGGTVKATSAGRGQGSEFTVLLPVFR